MTVASHSDALNGTPAPLSATVLCMRGYQPLGSHRLRVGARQRSGGAGGHVHDRAEPRRPRDLLRHDLHRRIPSAQPDFAGVDNTFNSPFNAWLINRGSVTLPLRMRQHNASAQAIAEHLQSLPQVRFVAYPRLESHPHHAFAASQLARPDAGFGGVLAFGLNTDHGGHNRFVSKLNVITSAVSLGHAESLIVFLGEDAERQYLYPPSSIRVSSVSPSVWRIRTT